MNDLRILKHERLVHIDADDRLEKQQVLLLATDHLDLLRPLDKGDCWGQRSEFVSLVSSLADESKAVVAGNRSAQLSEAIGAQQFPPRRRVLRCHLALSIRQNLYRLHFYTSAGFYIYEGVAGDCQYPETNLSLSSPEANFVHNLSRGAPAV